jgi:hypothetical protein
LEKVTNLSFTNPDSKEAKEYLLERIKGTKTTYFEHQHQVLNAQELATIWHPTGFLLEGVRNVAWGRTLKGEPPEDLPVAPFVPVNQEGVPDEAGLQS